MASFESRLIFVENSPKGQTIFFTIDFFIEKRKSYTTYLKNVFHEISSKNVFIQLGKNCWRFVFFLFLYH